MDSDRFVAKHREIEQWIAVLCFRMGTTKEGQITKRDVFEMAGVIPTKWLDNLFDVVNKNSFENLQKFVDVMFCEGFSGSQLINQV